MIRVLRWQLAHGYGGEALLDRLTRLLPRYGLPLDIPCDETALRRWLTRDKEAEGDQVTLALAEEGRTGPPCHRAAGLALGGHAMILRLYPSTLRGSVTPPRRPRACCTGS